MASGCWRIDELAQKAGVPVDTIRYYAREGLLDPPERSGRHKLYSPDHLERLQRIRDLQARRFSLAAIKALLAEPHHPGLERVFADGGREYSVAELVQRSGVDAGLVDSLHSIGLLSEPADIGKEGYDELDLNALRAVAELIDIGMPPSAVIDLGNIYVRHFRDLQRDVHQLFAGASNREWDPEELRELQLRLTANLDRMMPAIERVLAYVHQRMAQRLTLEAVRTAEETRTGVGGVRVSDDE